MAANTNAIFTLAGNSIPAFSAAANLASDGSGTLINLVTAATDGTRVDKVVFRNAQASAAGSSPMLCKVFLTDAAGANPQIVGEVAIATATRSASVIGATGEVLFSPALVMKAGQILKFTQTVYAGVQDRMSAVAYAGDFNV